MTWATSTGSAVVGSLVPTAAQYDSTIVESGVTYGLIKYTFSGSPNLSGVLAGHRLTVAGFTNAENNGTYRVYDANDTTDEIRVYNTSRLSNSLDETGVTGTGSVADAGAVLTEPSTAKKAQGFLTPEKPSDGMWNWILNDIYDSILSFSVRATTTIFKAVSGRSTDTLDLIYDQAIYRFDSTDTRADDGETIIEPDDGTGRAIIESPTANALWAYTTNDFNESLPVVTESLDFASISAGAIGTQTVTVYGASEGDIVNLGAPSTIDAGLIWSGFVSADDTVTIRLYNTTGGAIDPADTIWAVEVVKTNRQPAISVGGLRFYTKLLGTQYTSGTLETDLAIGDNEAEFIMLLNSTWRRKVFLNDAAIKAVIQGSALANAAMELYEGAGY